MKRLISVVLLTVLLLCGGMSALGLHEGAVSPELDRVLDGADLIGDGRENSLEKKISRLSEKYGFDILVITVDSNVGDIETYSEDIYDTHGYGYGEDRDGILLIVSLFEREILISATGSGEQIFTDYGRDRILDLIFKKFSNGDYEGGISKFVTLSEKFLQKAEKGEPYDYDEKFHTPANYAVAVLVCVVIGCAVGGIIVFVQMSGMKTALRKKNASGYIVPGSMVMGTGRDVFITSIVTKTPKAPPPSQGGKGGRGGSTSHMSSSGRSHSSSRRSF